MKIKITTERMPWINDKPHIIDEELEGIDEECQLLIDNGFAVQIVEPTKRAAKTVTQ